MIPDKDGDTPNYYWRKMENGDYKWSYDPRDGILDIWHVRDSGRSAQPMHYQVKGDEGYLHCSQGRLTVAGETAGGVIYNNRPIKPEGASAIRETAKQKVEEEIGSTVNWREES